MISLQNILDSLGQYLSIWYETDANIWIVIPCFAIHLHLSVSGIHVNKGSNDIDSENSNMHVSVRIGRYILDP